MDLECLCNHVRKARNVEALKLTWSQFVDFYVVSSYSGVKGSESADWASTYDDGLHYCCECCCKRNW